MNRSLYTRLVHWKESPVRKPLLLQGTRFVGKTFLVKEFAEKEFDGFITLDFEQSPGLASLFGRKLHPLKILENISIYLGRRINWETTLLFLDEVQTAPEVISCLTSFPGEVPYCSIIAAVSVPANLPGPPDTVPEAGMQHLTLYPLTFREYLMAAGEKILAEKLLTLRPQEAFPEIIHNKLLDHLAMYLFLGGMPEVILAYLNSGDLSAAREKQTEIRVSLEKDFRTYAGRSQKTKTAAVWNAIPDQLAGENKKFRFNRVHPRGRASTWATAIRWLKENGLIRVVYRMEVPRLSLRGYEGYSQFRLYPFDTGLLGAMLNLPAEPLTPQIRLFSRKNDALLETFMASELVAAGFPDLFYWASPSDARVDFILLHGNHIYPLEVKSDTGRNIRNLRSYESRYHPGRIFTVSPLNFMQRGNYTNIPLYAIPSVIRG